MENEDEWSILIEIINEARYQFKIILDSFDDVKKEKSNFIISLFFIYNIALNI